MHLPRCRAYARDRPVQKGFKTMASDESNRPGFRQVDSLIAAGRYEEALELSAALNRRQPTVQSLLVEGKLLRRASRTHEAVVILRGAYTALMRLRLDTDDQPGEEPQNHETLDQHYDVLKELADCHAALGDIHLAREYYRRAMALAPNEAAPHVGLGTIAIGTGRLEEAEESFRAALAVAPDCAEAYGGLAMAAQHRRDYDAALEMYQRCLESDADNLVALLGLFQTSCQLVSFAKIIYYLELYLDKHPDETSMLFCLATLYARQGRLSDARESLLALLAMEPDKIEAAALLEEVRLASAAVTT